MRYVLAVWGGSSVGNLNRVLTLQSPDWPRPKAELQKCFSNTPNNDCFIIIDKLILTSTNKNKFNNHQRPLICNVLSELSLT